MTICYQWRSFVFTALFRPTSLHVFVSFVTHRAVLFAAGSISLFAFVDVSKQTVFGHAVTQNFLECHMQNVSVQTVIPTTLPGPPTLRRAFFMIVSTSSQNISISPVTGAEVSLDFSLL